MATAFRNRPGAVPQRRKGSARDSYDSDIYKAPRGSTTARRFPRGRYGIQWVLGLPLHIRTWACFGIFSLCLMVAYIPSLARYDRDLDPVLQHEGINPNQISPIPSLYNDITYNASRKDGNIFKGKLDVLPGDLVTVNRRFTNEMPNFGELRRFTGLLEELQIDSDMAYQEYMLYYDAVRGHIENAIILTNALIEDFVTIEGLKFTYDGIHETYNFRPWSSKGYLWCHLYKCGHPLKLARRIYLQYLTALREGYRLPRKKLYNRRTVGLRRIIDKGERLLPLLEATKNTSRVIRFTVKHGIEELLSTEARKPPSLSELWSRQWGDAIGYMEHWIKNDFADGQRVREVEIPRYIRDFQQSLKIIEEEERRVLKVFLHKGNKLDAHFGIECHIDQMEKALRDLVSHYNFESIFPGHPNRPRAIWEVHKSILKREGESHSRNLTMCGRRLDREEEKGEKS